VTDNQLQLIDDTTQESVPHPEFEMLNEVDPAVFGKLKEVGDTYKPGVVLAACVTEIVLGLPVAPEAVMVMVPDRDAQVALAT
jgi:hypothetical protein